MDHNANLFGHRTATPGAVAHFGQLTGDFSRIHFDHALGEASTHGRGFAHGLLSASWALGTMTLHTGELLGCGDPGACISSFETRFHAPVLFGDTLALECHEIESSAKDPGWTSRRSAFAFMNQSGEKTTSGSVVVHSREPGALLSPWPESPEPGWAGGKYSPPGSGSVMGAEEMIEHGPRGSSPIRTVTEADIVNFVNFTGELNPLYLNTVFAEGALFGERIAPPMLCFSLGFSAWLRELMRLPLGGDPANAGHLGDRWRFVAPVRIGDTLEVRYRPIAFRPTRSRPTLAVATFGLQLLNQREEVVQQGEVDMMLPVLDGEKRQGIE